MAKRKSWSEKLADSKGLPKLAEMPAGSRWGAGTLLVPAPREVDAVMRRVPPGRLITINEIRRRLAKKHRADVACPLTTGIFSWIAAHAAAEAEDAGGDRITPYWRTLKAGGELNAKYPGGIPELRRRLAAEGHRVAAKGKRFVVVNYEAVLVGKP